VVNNGTTINVAINTTEGARFEFPCSGRSDDSTPVTISWYRLSDEKLMEHVVIVPNKRMVSDNGSLIVQLEANDTEGWAHYGGQYECRVSNGYSFAVRKVSIAVLDLPANEGIYCL